MGRILRSCLQSMLKMVNSVGGLVGVAFILYGLWMMRVWYREFHSDRTLPWFIYTSLGLGVSLCLITCFGHIAAETSNGHCISFYMVLIFLLVMLEAAITADVILNKDWEEDFPDDTTGRFNEFKNFIRSNFELCQWVGLTIVTAQGMSIFLAMILKALGPHRGSSYDSDDDSVNARLPLLRNQVQQGATYVCDPHVPYKSDSWNVR
ncbi:tetraspanin-19-like [Curcuma longa]|uniref:tetraspanin-19-like n=1 Tax=Curcuma longa TaxID=136217 RepID=UPI003D9EB46B